MIGQAKKIWAWIRNDEGKNLHNETMSKISQVKKTLEFGSSDTKPFQLTEDWQSMEQGGRVKLITVESWENGTVAIYKADAGTVFDIHSHPQSEEIYILEGSLKELHTKKLYKHMDSIYIGPNKKHGALYPEESIIVLVWRPQLHVKND